MTLRSVLIIDDNKIDRLLLKRNLEKIEVTDTIFECLDGVDALSFLQKKQELKNVDLDKIPPTLIFLDINMPIMNGFEFLKEFAKLKEIDNSFESIVFTMFTSSSNDEDKEIALSYDFVKDYIVKGSLNAEGLRKFINKHFPL